MREVIIGFRGLGFKGLELRGLGPRFLGFRVAGFRVRLRFRLSQFVAWEDVTRMILQTGSLFRWSGGRAYKGAVLF